MTKEEAKQFVEWWGQGIHKGYIQVNVNKKYEPTAVEIRILKPREQGETEPEYMLVTLPIHD
jgi:hypothetical protein